MKIAWNKVTWYSKALAMGVFILLPFLAFCFGLAYGELFGSLSVKTSLLAEISAETPTNVLGLEYYNNPAEWQLDNRTKDGFSVSYPIDFQAVDDYSEKLSTDWSSLGTQFSFPGKRLLTIIIPKALEPQTNFNDAILTIGKSSSNTAVAGCLSTVQPGNISVPVSNITVNGNQFAVFHSNDAGAGNYYDTTSYHIVRNGSCYVLEYTIHSSQIDNYPASYNLHPFNEGMLANLMNRIAGTFNLH